MIRKPFRVIPPVFFAFLLVFLSFPGLSQAPGRIAFQKLNGKHWDLWLMNDEGRELRQLTTDPANEFDPCWSPDGTKLVFVTDRHGNKDLYTVDVATGAETRLTESPADDYHPAWSPDGGRIAFASKRDGKKAEIYSMNPDGSDQIRLTNNDDHDEYPVWSPDGRRIAYTVNKIVSLKECLYAVCLVNADGSDNKALITSPTEWYRNPVWAPR